MNEGGPLYGVYMMYGIMFVTVIAIVVGAEWGKKKHKDRHGRPH